MTEPDGLSKTVSRDELQRVVAQRQRLKKKIAEMEAQNQALEGELAQAAKAASPDVDRTLLEQFKDSELKVAAARAGAQNPDQVAALLASGGAHVVDDHGRHEVLVAGEDGEMRPAEDAARRFLSDAANANLLRSDRVADYKAAREHQEKLAAALATPPENMDELSEVPEDLREDVIDGMSPAQRDAIANPAPLLHTL